MSLRSRLLPVILLMATAARAQSVTAPPDPRVLQLLSHSTSGSEQQVACDALEPDVGRALIAFGRQARTESLDRLTIVYRLAERAPRCRTDDPLLRDALNGVSDTLYNRGQFDGALAAAEETLAISTRLDDEVGVSAAWNRIGNVHWWLGETQPALNAFQHSLDAAGEDAALQGRAWNNIANVYKSIGEFDTALDHYARARQVFEALGDRGRTALVVRNIADVYFRRGEYRTALDISQRALEMNREVGDDTRISSNLDLSANIYRAVGAYQKALQLFQEALAIRTKTDDRAGAMETTHNIGLVYFSQGDYELAIGASRRALHLNRVWDLRDDTLVAEALRNIGAAAWRLGQRDRAVANFRESLAVAERAHLASNEGALMQELGQAALEIGRTAEGLTLLARSLSVRQRIGDQAGVTETLAAQSAANLAAGQPDAALRLAKSAMDNAMLHEQPELLWNAQTLLGIAERRLGHGAEARSAFAGAIDTIERLSTQVVVGENLRQQFFENKLSPYHELGALLVDEHAFGKALEVAERSKARVLTRLLQRTALDEAAALTADEKRERARLRDRLFTLNRQIDDRRAKPAADDIAIAGLESERRDAREMLAAFEVKLTTAHPELAAARGPVKPLTIAELGQVIEDPGTAVVEYVVTDRRLFIFVLTSDGRQVVVDQHSTAISSRVLATRASSFRDRIAARNLDAIDDARQLYGVLMAPIAKSIEGRSRVVIVPDGSLWNVPFQALRGPKGYLLEVAAVSYAPSITALLEIERLPKPNGSRTLLAMGKSTFGPDSQSGLDPLPEAERQVAQIRSIYGVDRSAVYVGAEATETHFKVAAPHYSVLHLATHAVLDESSPMYSHLVLSPATNSPEDDGRLEAWEIVGLKLRADLVVLAACDTGRGRIATGEGVIGTMWAFFGAGARSLVVSQFRVESKSTTALLLAFHRRFAREPGSKADHLRAAALELLHTPRYAHPYYWAGFILAGDAN